MPYFQLELIARLVLAAALGGVIGAERERRLYSGAGLRTHALVSTASALVMIVSAYGFDSVLVPGKIVLDPARVAAQVVSGVGFLGAGIIIFRRNVVHGLTTAASIWAVAAVGLAAGCGLYVCAAVATLIMCFILTVLKKVERYFPARQLNRLTIEVSDSSQINAVSEKLRTDRLKITNMNVKRVKGSGNSVIKVEAVGDEKVFVGVLNELHGLPGVAAVEYVGRALPVFESGDDEEPS